MKSLIVEIEDSTRAELVERVEVKHLSDLGHEVKAAIDDFVRLNKGAVLPPVSIRVREKNRSGTCGDERDLPA
jgi:hypothetical protein